MKEQVFRKKGVGERKRKGEREGERKGIPIISNGLSI